MPAGQQQGGNWAAAAAAALGGCAEQRLVPGQVMDEPLDELPIEPHADGRAIRLNKLNQLSSCRGSGFL
jgi:hypothetical protein